MIKKKLDCMAGPLRPERNGQSTTVVAGPVNREVDPVRAPFQQAMHGIKADPLGPDPREAHAPVSRLVGRTRRGRSIPGVEPVKRCKPRGWHNTRTVIYDGARSVEGEPMTHRARDVVAYHKIHSYPRSKGGES